MTIPKIFTFAERHDDETCFRFIKNHIHDFKDAMYDLEEAWDHARADEVVDEFYYQYEVIKDNLRILRERDVDESDCACKENLNALRVARTRMIDFLHGWFVEVLRDAAEMREEQDWDNKFDLDFDWITEALEEEETKE